jgi:excinuclease UvrABC ATPase subunit
VWVRREPQGATTLVYVIDEPTTGVHFADVEQLLALLSRLVDARKSVIVCRAPPVVMAHANWIIHVCPRRRRRRRPDHVRGQPTLTGKHFAAFVGI